MARNSDRQFSESESLKARDQGASFPEAEERLPAWAQEREETAERERDNANQAPEQDAEGPGEEARPDGSFAGPDAPTGREQAQEAWNREAQRVESSQFRRNMAQDPAKEEKKSKKTAKGKKNGKKGGPRKKKNSSRQEEKHSFLRTMAIVLICGGLFLMVALMVVSNFVSHPLLSVPRKIVNKVVAPVQSAFSGVTDSVVKYLRTLKIRGNLEYEYEQLSIQVDDMANDLGRLQELIHENQALRDILQEQKSNPEMNGLFAQVIGKVGNNYFSTLTLNVGTADGVSDYMAVVDKGGLVGVTYNTMEHTCQVRCIIDSDCTVAGLVQSSRDQGSVKGTLGTTGEPMCRMYYLPDNSLPRPGDVVVTSGVGLEFPKGIPIGYIRESTRGMEDNKSYVVLEPVVDFQHLEYVTVYRYRPYYAEDAQSRTSTSSNLKLEPLATARPVPGFNLEGLSDFIYAATAAPEAGQEAVATPTPEPDKTPVPTAVPDPNATPVPENLEYHAADLSGATATPSPRPTFTPTPSPVPTPDAGAMTVEDDE